MEPELLFGIVGLLILLLSVLRVWQRKIERIEEHRTRTELAEARDRGSCEAHSQHPQVDPLRCLGCGSCVAACPEEDVLGLVDGIASIIHGSRCVGHGLCAEACPVGAIRIGLGDIATRSDIPRLSAHLETTTPGIYIAGELGGIALIRNAVEQGRRAVDAIAEDLHREGPVDGPIADLFIAGAGPAGLAASLAAVERGLRYITVDQDDIGGTILKYPRRKLTMTQPFTLPLFGPVRKSEYLKEELVELWHEVVESFRLEVLTSVRLLAVERRGDRFLARTTGGDFEARRVCLALGRRGTPRKLGVPGEELEKVLYQLIDAATYEGERILVVGGGDSAIEAATALANQKGNVVTISYRKGAFVRLKARNEARIEEYLRSGRIRAVFSSEVHSVEADRVVLRVRDEGGSGTEPAPERLEALDNDRVFIFAGGDPPYPLLRAMGVAFGCDAAASEPARVEIGLVGARP